ncbi:MAG TPA: glutamate--tRNA ligase family protein [Blastocatellia bacterium]|nr:glutamate--tRNA ligase family protein [Blastocatellia bacterium]
MDIKPNHLSTVGAETNAPDRERWRGIAEILFPNWRELPSLEQLEERYPVRVLPEGAMVTRLGPSPTGMMHIGGLYVGLINHKLAHQTQGLFFLRVEDTDTKRSVEGAYETIVNSLIDYGLTPDEGPVRDPAGEFLERGAYGPYVQTARKTLYHACAFDLIGRGAMYPCFMSESELEAIRTEQRAAGLRSGVYGLWAKSRQLTFDEIEARIRAGAAFVLRLRSMGDPNRTVNWNDGVRGTLSLPEYDVDAVLIKSDGIPTYHFAHLVDDHFMRSTHVIRAEEWVSSVPLHLQLFSLMGWAPPQYAHISAIQKFGEAGGKRKLSKRTDPEADVQFYWSNGFPTEAVIDYLMNLANSDFEDWRRANPEADYTAFSLTLEKMGVAGPVADMVKLESISREVLSRMSTARLYECSQLWTATFDPELAAEMRKDPDYACRALNIERNPESSAKRLVTLKSLRANLGPFYDRFLPDVRDLPFPAQIPAEDRNRILAVIRERFQETDPPEQFFERLKGIAAELGFAPTVKEYKKNAERFKGHVGDVAMIVRVAIFGSSNSPDLGQVMHVLGRERVVKRCERAMTA